MPFKSKAQRRKFAELLVTGKISPETYEEWNRETGGKVSARAREEKEEGEEAQDGETQDGETQDQQGKRVSRTRKR